MAYITRREATYYFSRRIPTHLIPHFNGRKFLRYSLRTKDIAIAKQRRNVELVKTDKQFQDLAAKAAETATITHTNAVLSVTHSDSGSETIAHQLKHLWCTESPQYEAASLAYHTLGDTGEVPTETLREALQQHNNMTEGVYTLKQLIDEHRTNHTAKLPIEASRREYEVIYGLLLSIFPPYKALTEIGRKEARELKEILEHLPPNHKNRRK